MTSQEAAKFLIDRKNIVILTGAGLSAASGVPTFRGANGLWTKAYAGQTDPTIILTQWFFKRNPQLCWQWHFDFLEMIKTCVPNKGHKAILKFQEISHHLKNEQNSPQFNTFLVTQNIDNFHAQLIRESPILSQSLEQPDEGSHDFAFTTQVHEIHGNISHCSNETHYCSRKFYLLPMSERTEDTEIEVPKCPECKSFMKPHCMFFDEVYSEKYYRSNTVCDYVEDKMDALIVVGTALQTNLANYIARKASAKPDSVTIEINPESSIEGGSVSHIHIAERSEYALENLFSEFYKEKGIDQSKITPTETSSQIGKNK